MKFFLIIIGFILSCNFSDRISFDEKVCCEIMQDTGNRNLDSDSCAILPSCATGCIGGNCSVTSPIDPQTQAAGFSLTQNSLSCLSRTGYCPQTDTSILSVSCWFSLFFHLVKANIISIIKYRISNDNHFTAGRPWTHSPRRRLACWRGFGNCTKGRSQRQVHSYHYPCRRNFISWTCNLHRCSSQA